MGNVAHTYMSKDYIIRYHDMNILVSRTGLILTIWRDSVSNPIMVYDEEKAEYDASTTHKENKIKANHRHKDIMREQLKNSIERKQLN
ncbi:hypothetical protein FPZ44_24075 [Paenibacillus agilis]|uniref:Uncharacterized protein n=2 Tax=Paenibacillus agilis TaxID=3020863 RepID=A0A559IEN7_9BACL|nr:hypothetical protein FPZ44_24075 [Paenibacillus agilis]